MDINLSVKRTEQIRSYYLFFVIFGIQMGVGILGTPKYVFEKAHHDAWVSVLIAYLFMSVVTIIMFFILSRYENTDIFGIQTHLFGKWLGKILGLTYLLFLLAELLSVLLNYIDIIQVFIFPTMPSYMMALILLILIVYSVAGGIRVIVGVVFLFVVVSPWFFPLLYDPISRMESAHFLPLFDASIIDLLKGAKTTAYTFLGLEILWIIFPFVDNKAKAKRPTYLGLTASMFIVLVTTIISIGYYSPNDFEKIDWPVLTLFKSVSFSFMERIDYFIVIEWMMFTIPTAILLLWAITHGTERIFQIKQNKTLYVVSVVLLILCTLFNTHHEIQQVSDFVSKIGFWIVFVYPIILLPIVLLKAKRKATKEVQHSND